MQGRCLVTIEQRRHHTAAATDGNNATVRLLQLLLRLAVVAGRVSCQLSCCCRQPQWRDRHTLPLRSA